MNNGTDFTSIQSTVFNIAMVITYVLYFVVAFGLSSSAPQHLSTMQFWIKLYISGFLIYRFNYFKKVYQFTDFDRKIAFSAGMFLLTTTIVDHFINSTTTPPPPPPTTTPK